MQVGFEVIKFIVGQVCPTDPPNTLIERIRHKKLLKRTYSLIHLFTFYPPTPKSKISTLPQGAGKPNYS